MEKKKEIGLAVGIGTAAAASYLLIQRVRAAPKPLTLHFEQPLGTPVDEVDTGTEFYCVGYYKKDATPLRDEPIYVYRVRADGRPTEDYASGATNEAGKYEIPWTAPSVDRDTIQYYMAFDSLQRP